MAISDMDLTVDQLAAGDNRAAMHRATGRRVAV